MVVAAAPHSVVPRAELLVLKRPLCRVSDIGSSVGERRWVRECAEITRSEMASSVGAMRTNNMWFRLVLAVASGFVTLLGTMTMGCDDRAGVSSWERCRSWLGNPILEWRGGDWSPIFPLLLGIAVGAVVWWLLGRGQPGSPVR